MGSKQKNQNGVCIKYIKRKAEGLNDKFREEDRYSEGWEKSLKKEGRRENQLEIWKLFKGPKES